MQFLTRIDRNSALRCPLPYTQSLMATIMDDLQPTITSTTTQCQTSLYAAHGKLACTMWKHPFYALGLLITAVSIPFFLSSCFYYETLTQKYDSKNTLLAPTPPPFTPYCAICTLITALETRPSRDTGKDLGI